ncbi:hypothetical protein SDJN02_00862, partial [Cucurbita argyrosperma subsp. argyrosperma]
MLRLLQITEHLQSWLQQCVMLWTMHEYNKQKEEESASAYVESDALLLEDSLFFTTDEWNFPMGFANMEFLYLQVLSISKCFYMFPASPAPLELSPTYLDPSTASIDSYHNVVSCKTCNRKMREMRERERKRNNGWMDGRTDGWTDGPGSLAVRRNMELVSSEKKE